MGNKVSEMAKNIGNAVGNVTQSAKTKKKIPTAEKQIINAAREQRLKDSLQYNPFKRLTDGGMQKASDGVKILNNYDYNKPLKYEALPGGDIRLTDNNEIMEAARAYNAAQDIKYYYDFVDKKRETDPYYAMGYDELRQKKAEASEKYLSGGMTWEEYNNISFDLTSKMANVANRKQLEELQSEVNDINEGYKKTKNYSKTPTSLMITRGTEITTAKEFYEALGGSIDERMNVYKLEDEAKNVTDEYRKMADKAGVTGEYAPTKEYKAYLFDANSSEDETYDMVNLYHSGKIGKNNIITADPSGNIHKEQLWMYLTPDEVVEYNRAYKMGKGKDYLKAMNPTLEIRKSKQKEKESYEYGKEHPIMGGLKSLGERVIYSPQAFVDNGIDWLTTGKVNTYDDSSQVIRNADARIAGGAEYMRQHYGEGAAVIYGGSISILENVANLYLGKVVGKAFGLGSKGVSNVVGANMFASSASSTMISIADRGGNTEQILLGGLSSGLAELVFEKYSVGKILDASDGVRTFKQILKNMPINAVTNIQEEAVTEIANIWLDSVIMGQQSESKILERQYINQGMSIEEARGKVFLNNISRVAESGIVGGFSGVSMGAMSDYGAYRYNNKFLGNPADIERIVGIGLELNNDFAKTVNEILENGGKIKTEDRSKLVESVVNDSVTKDATLPGVVKVIGAIEGRNSDYYTSDEAIDTANAVLKMTNGTATKADYSLIERSEGARTVILSAEGTKAWDSLKAEADKRMRNTEYGMRSDTPHPSPAVTPSPQGEGFDVRSEGKSATISDGEIISNGEKVTIDNTSKVAGNVVLDEESYNFRKVNKEGYKAIQTMAKDLGMKVKYVDGLTDSEGKALDGVITSEGIFINTQSKNPTRWAATHEFSHRMKQTGGKMWQRYQDYVISHLKETGKYEERYNLKKGAYAENEIDEEIASDYIGEMFADVKELSNFIRRNRRDAFGIRNAYYKVLDKLGLLSEKKKAQAMWAKAYREAMKNSDAEYEDGNKYSRKFDKKKKSWYSEYRTNAMKWAFATDRKPGDTTIMSTNYDGYALLEATNDGYVEIKKGSYKEVKAEYERAYKNATNEVYGNTESFEADQGRDIWDLQYDEDGGNGSGNNQKIKRQGFQNDTSRNDEHLRSSNKRKSVSGTRVEESESLKEENARLRAELENIHLQLEQAEGKGLDTKAIKKAAEDIKRAYFSKIKTSELHKDLTKLYSDMANNKLGGDEIGERIREIADKVIAGATETIEYSEYGDLLNTIRTTRIAVPEDDKASFADGFSQFKKSNRGKLNLNDDGYPLDALWDDLCADYPQLFSEDTRGSEERLNRLLEVRDEFSPYEKAVFGSTESVQKARYALENDIMESFFKIPEGGDGKYVFYDTRASQAQKELQQAKEKYEKLLEKTVKRLEGKIEKTELAYENEINRIEQRHERELDEMGKAVEKAEEKNEKLRDRYDREKVKKGIDRYFNYLFRMYSDPTDARHIPEALRRDVGNILERINFETKYTDKLKEKGEESALSIRLDGIAEVFRRIQSEAWGVISTDDSPTIDSALRQELEELISEIPVDESGNSKRLSDMTTEELKAVYEMLMAVHHAVTKSNEAFSDSISGKIDENAEKVDREMENVRSKKKGSGEKIEGEGGKIRAAYNSLDKFVNADLYKPWDFFNKIGGTMQKLYMATRTAFDNYLKNLQTFKKKLDKATEKINVKKLNNVETIKLLGGAEIKLTRGQMIGIVATYKRPAGRTHILEGGIVTSRPWKDENGHKRTGVAPIKLNEHDVGVITEMLTKEEKDMMFALVDFMSKECSKWGNETSVKLLGYEKYGEGWYYPVKVWDGSLDKSAAKKGEKNLTNKSFTKKLAPNAGNAIEINDFLDVVMDHVNSMNMYSTVALPLLDMERILNHKGEGTASKDVREAIRITYGKNAEKYIYEWIRSVNGTAQKVERDFLDKLIANTKKAQIAFKLSVFLKQGTSIFRVLQVMNPVHLRSALKSYIHPKKTIREMQENVPIAFWKSLGFRDPAMGTGIKNALLGTESLTDKLGFGLYGLADDFTWGMIYNAVKTEIKSKNKGIDVNSEEFKQKVVERFNYIIDRTQVVDSPFHSAQIMKSNNPLTKLTTSYMSEALTTLNLYRTDLQDATNEAIEKGTSRPIMAKAIRSTSTFLLSSLLLAIAGALPKMLKEDPEDKYDDDGKKVSGWKRLQTYVEEGFADESNPFNLVPYLNKVIDIWEGWEQKDWSFETIEDVVNSIKNFTTEEGQKKGWYAKIKDFASATMALIGIPYGNAVKEIEGIAKTVMNMSAGEYGDYLITKSKWNVKDPKNKTKFMKHYENAIINGDSEEANAILTDYLKEMFPDKKFDNKYSKEVLEEMTELYGKTDEDSKLLLEIPDDSFSYDGNKIVIPQSDYDEYVEGYYAKLWDLAYGFVTSEEYDKLSNEEKVKAFGEIKSYSEAAQRSEDVEEYELTGWKKEVYEGETEFIDNFVERQEKNIHSDAKKEWKEQNFNFDESEYSEAEVSSMNEFEDTAAAFYTSQEMGIPYEEGKYRRVQVYHDYLKDVMSLEEFAEIKAYANKVASTMGEGSTDSMSTKELKAYLDTLDYDTKTKGALFEAIGNKPWKNPYVGGKVGDGTVFPVLTASPVAGESVEIEVPETEPKTKTYTNKQTSQKSGSTNKSKYTPIQTIEIRRVEKDAESYYNSPRLTNYSGSKLRHINVYETKLKPYMSLDNYAKIRAEAYGNKSTITPADLEQYLSQLDFEEQIKAALFEAIGEENWENPFEG